MNLFSHKFETNLKNPKNIETHLALKRLGMMHMNTISAGFEMTMVAQGKWEGRITKEPFGKTWDFAPGSLLISEAGGVVTNIGKDTYDYHNLDYLMTNPVIHKELTEGVDALFPLI